MLSVGVEVKESPDWGEACLRRSIYVQDMGVGINDKGGVLKTSKDESGTMKGHGKESDADKQDEQSL
ncbi:hypothetical protein NDU88_001966 [Pleurodeles waltl]|uniref:Uncharacterized protein n=1 Tax=Pleurodeles waltl TaxID=8319 RepID=A0AAV7NEY8_PLEWA|nr:hypothetical protein NDU88_001966 [Pleurodeles waltl]